MSGVNVWRYIIRRLVQDLNLFMLGLQSLWIVIKRVYSKINLTVLFIVVLLKVINAYSARCHSDAREYSCKYVNINMYTFEVR